jgi:glycerol-3-phosphate dehydrogenase (NAD(P)+)
VKLGIIGGGAWGTALAQVASTDGKDTLLWAFEEEVVSAINESHENSIFLAGIPLNPSIRATSDLRELESCDAWLVVTPAQHMRRVLDQAPRCGRPLVLCSKGIEEGSGKLLHKVASEASGGAPVAVLSGPTFAHEVAKGMPTAVTLATGDHALAERLRDRIAVALLK